MTRLRLSRPEPPSAPLPAKPVPAPPAPAAGPAARGELAHFGLIAAVCGLLMLLIRSFELQFVHGLFQTEDYAHAVTALGYGPASSDETERRVSLRMRRQEVLDGADPPRVWFVIDEAALRRPIGGRQVMRAQLKHLLEAAALPHVTIQVVPFRRGGHAAAGGSFTILRFAAPDLPDVVYLEHLTSALYLDDLRDVDHYMEVMNVLSAEPHPPTATTRFLKEIIQEI